MNYQSTRNTELHISSCEAIAKGLSDDGGLFVPCEFPSLRENLEGMVSLDYKDRAKIVLSKFLTDFSPEEINNCVENAYKGENFDCSDICSISLISPQKYILELWHGPTCAFKDMALQILPYLLTVSAKKVNKGKETVILVATSGDTGKAALDGFCDVENTKIIVFYPEDGVSNMQKLQMTTQEGENVEVCAVKGNFDHAQNGVKAIFGDQKLSEKLLAQNKVFSSANSINWGRLVPQIVYYVSAYLELVKQGEISLGDSVNVAVPTGNFGNILAAYYAKMMGIPFTKMICASNANNVLTDFIETGVYNRNRTFYQTASPSMDILISSNLERLLFELSDSDDREVCELFGKLKNKGIYEITDSMKSRLQRDFAAGFCDDVKTKETIAEVFKKTHYLLDTHTAVAVAVYEEYVQKTGDKTKTLIASTASPYKFAGSVIDAIAPEYDGEDEADMLGRIEELSGLKIPASLAKLGQKKVRFKDSIEPDEMKEYVEKILGV